MAPADGNKDDAHKKLFELLAQARDRLSVEDALTPSGITLLDEISGGQLTWRELAAAARIPKKPREPEIFRPPHLLDFLVAYTQEIAPQTILDPMAVSPLIAAALNSECRSARTKAITLAQPVAAAGSHLDDDVDWLTEYFSFDHLERTKNHYDLVVTSPPIGMGVADRARRDLFQTLSEPILLPDEVWRRNASYLGLALAAERLSSSGHLVALLAESFFFSSDGVALREHLANRGIHLNAALSVPGGLLPATNIEPQLLFFSREPTKELFIGRVTRLGANRELLANMLSRRLGAELELGALVDPANFGGWGPTAAARELQQRLARQPNVTSLSEIATAVERANRIGTPSTNAVFIAEMRAKRRVATELEVDEEDGLRRSRYLVIELAPDLADARYVADWLNSVPGELALKAAARGSHMERIPRENLLNLRLPVPSIAEQRVAVELRQKIVGLQAELSVVADQIADEPANALAAERRLERLLAGDDLRVWMERVPFPLASILARYQADGDPRNKIEHLKHFFEAAAQFFAATLLSAARRNESRWDEVRAKLAEGSQSSVPLLQRADFGGWIQIGRTIAKDIRKSVSSLAENSDAAEERREVMGIGDKAFVDGLISRKCWNLLDEARKLRNHQAHGGVMGSAQIADDLATLEDILEGLRTELISAFERVTLIEPGGSEYVSGVYRHHRSRSITGPNAIFREDEISSLIPLDARQLHFVDANENIEDALTLIGLVKLEASPATEENTCFFFNARERDGHLRYVSYYLATEASSSITDPEVAGLIDELAQVDAQGH